MRSDFAVFILTNQRADNVVTYKVLKKHGYSGDIYLIVDNEDPQRNKYKKLFKDQVIIFDKQKAFEKTDSGDNSLKKNAVVYARNESFNIAKNLGIRYFWQLDDDYTTFRHTFNDKGEYITKQPKIKNLDKYINFCIEFLKETPFKSLAFSQGGDFIGGGDSWLSNKFKKGEIPRKIMNSFFFDTEKPVSFMGRINEDVNLYISEGRKGELFGTVAQLRLEQGRTQANSGGLTDIYLDLGTYVKSFYTVLYAPSCTTLAEMGVTSRRIHHRIDWNAAIPKILDYKYKKKSLKQA